MTQQKPLVVSMGEPAGIGPDIILSAWANRKAQDLPFFYVIGNKDCLQTRAELLDLKVPLQLIETPADSVQSFETALPIYESMPLSSVQPGQLNPDHGTFIVDAIKQGVQAISNNQASGLVTAPLHKANLYQTGFAFPGHTEYLAHLSEQLFDQKVRPVMMLASDLLKVVPLTIHVPLKDVPGLLNQDLIIETVKIVAQDLQSRFGIKQPRIFLTGLNPHAGEEGTMGSEEIEIITPAITKLKQQGLNVSGPFSADTCFHAKAREQYDVMIAMYHDQALIPIKSMSFDKGVNVTLGLPFIRTSPDHGTALSIAGTGKADPLSFICALKMAAQQVQLLS